MICAERKSLFLLTFRFCYHDPMIGTRLREARIARHLSLADVAGKVHVSIATLSRIERDQQNLDVALFLALSKILRASPHDLLDGEQPEPNDDPLAARIAALDPAERTRLWRELTTARKTTSTERAATRALSLQVEELLAQVDFLRGELEAVKKRVKRR